MKEIAKIISWVFLPLFMPIYALIIPMYLPSMEEGFYQKNTLFWMRDELKLAVLGIFTLFSFIAPAITLLILKSTNKISNIEVDNQQERAIPVLITVLYCCILTWFLFEKTPEGLLPQPILLLPIGGLIALPIAALVNKYDKISLHAIGVGMLFGFLVGYYQHQIEFNINIILLSCLLSGLVMSSRIYLKKHTLEQSLAGFGLGFITLFGLLFFFWK